MMIQGIDVSIGNHILPLTKNTFSDGNEYTEDNRNSRVFLTSCDNPATDKRISFSDGKLKQNKCTEDSRIYHQIQGQLKLLSYPQWSNFDKNEFSVMHHRLTKF